jgi:hypothetical protein
VEDSIAHSCTLAAGCGQAVAIEVNRGHDLSAQKPFTAIGSAAWRIMQLRARNFHVIEINGDTWRGLSLRQRLVHLQAKLVAPLSSRIMVAPPGSY